MADVLQIGDRVRLAPDTNCARRGMATGIVVCLGRFVHVQLDARDGVAPHMCLLDHHRVVKLEK